MARLIVLAQGCLASTVARAQTWSAPCTSATTSDCFNGLNAPILKSTLALHIDTFQFQSYGAACLLLPMASKEMRGLLIRLYSWLSEKKRYPGWGDGSVGKSEHCTSTRS